MTIPEKAVSHHVPYSFYSCFAGSRVSYVKILAAQATFKATKSKRIRANTKKYTYGAMRTVPTLCPGG
jgi:hypothetical protein